MKFITLLLLAIPMAATANLPNSSEARNHYINQFAEFAMTEMHRSGVPASITLAQGLVESNAGQSELSRKSLNHFGIKCKRNWEGKTVYYKDDDYKNGKLVESCFRAYDSVLDSYADHSNFLMNNSRYERLFKLHPTDFRGWAIGLKDCGYATNPKYAEMLIRIIEEYHLYLYDVPKKKVVDVPTFQVEPQSPQPQVPMQSPEKEEIGMPAIILEVPKYQLPEMKKEKKQKRKRLFKRKSAAAKVRPAVRPIQHSIGTR